MNAGTIEPSAATRPAPPTRPAPLANPRIAAMSEGRKLALFAVMAFGQFMALLDIQIVAASLNSIQAGLSAGPDEIAWVQTSYLMAEIVMIPLSGYLSQALSTRWLFAGSAALFTISSVACGSAWDIESMIVFRAIQGFVGGAMVPTVFATGYQLFSGKRLAMIPAILGMVSTLAPTLGPTIGGWVTETTSWRWLFFMNVAPGIAVTVLVPLLGHVDDPKPELLKRIDWVHLLGLAVFLGALQYALEEGPRHEWLDDFGVATAAMLSAIGACVFLERSLFSTLPLVSLAPLRIPTFAMACVLNVVIGFGLYSATYLTPVFLGRVRDFSSFDIGTTVFVAGITMFVGAPIAARLSVIADPRRVIAVGFLGFATSLYLFSDITSDWGFWELLVPQAVRGLFLLMCIVPAVGLSLGSLTPDLLKAGSGLFNVMRNLGGAIGIALVNTWVQDGARTHALRLGEAMGVRPDAADEAVRGLASLIGRWTPDGVQALLMAQGEMARIVSREALTLAFRDVYMTMALLFVAALAIVPFCRRPPVAGAPAADH
jgi:DHA2 family multidrug resistance protein